MRPRVLFAISDSYLVAFCGTRIPRSVEQKSSNNSSRKRSKGYIYRRVRWRIFRTDVAYAGTRRSLVETKAWELQQIVEGLSVTALSAEIQELMHSMETRNAELQEENRALEEMCAQHVDTILKAQQFATAAKGQAAKDTTQAETQAPSPTGEEQEPAKEEPGIEVFPGVASPPVEEEEEEPAKPEVVEQTVQPGQFLRCLEGMSAFPAKIFSDVGSCALRAVDRHFGHHTDAS